VLFDSGNDGEGSAEEQFAHHLSRSDQPFEPGKPLNPANNPDAPGVNPEVCLMPGLMGRQWEHSLQGTAVPLQSTQLLCHPAGIQKHPDAGWCLLSQQRTGSVEYAPQKRKLHGDCLALVLVLMQVTIEACCDACSAIMTFRNDHRLAGTEQEDDDTFARSAHVQCISVAA